MLFAQCSKRLCSFLLVRARQSASRYPGGIVAHELESLVGFSKQRVRQTPRCFQVRTHTAFLAPIDLERQFEEKGRGLRSLHGALPLHTCAVASLPFNFSAE